MPPGSVSFSAEKALGTIRPRVQIAGTCGGVCGWDTEIDLIPTSIHAMHPLNFCPYWDFLFVFIIIMAESFKTKKKIPGIYDGNIIRESPEKGAAPLGVKVPGPRSSSIIIGSRQLAAEPFNLRRVTVS